MYRKSMRSALEEARAYSAVNEVKVSKGGKTLSISKRDVGVYQAKGWSLQEANMKRILQALQDKLSDEGGAAGFDDLKKTAKSMGLNLTPAMLKDMPGIKQHRDGDYILEELDKDDKETIKPIIKQLQKSVKTHDKQAKQLQKDIKDEVELGEATPVPPRDLMLTYGKPGEKVKAYYTKFMQDLQNKAHELRKKGFVVDKMGLTQPMSKLRDRIPEEINTDTYADSKKKMLNKEGTELVEFTLADYRELESDNQHDIAAKKLIDKFGTSQEKSTINDINRRHAKTGYISGTDFRLRTMIVNRYYSRLK